MTETVNLKATPLRDTHRRLGAKMVPFGGWELPVHYPTGILNEAKAVRESAGLFDVSHMGRIEVHGSAALDILEFLTPNRVAALLPGAGHYTLFLNERVGIIDDLILFAQEPNLYFLVVNASNRDTDVAWMRSHSPNGLFLTDRTGDSALLALQGPLSVQLMSEAGDNDAGSLKRFHRMAMRLFSLPTWVMRTGYTGEDGFEIQCAARDAVALWNHLLKVAGTERLTPCGLGARDILRIEAGYPLHGHEIDADTDPREAGLEWVLRKAEGFVGAEALNRTFGGTRRWTIGLEMETRRIARSGAVVLDGEVECGRVTSGTFSPHRNASIAMARVDAGLSEGGVLTVECGGHRQSARIVPLPFIDLPVAASRRRIPRSEPSETATLD